MNSAVLYVTTVLIWGSTWLAIRLQLGSVAPELSIAYRMMLAAVMLLAYSLLRKLPLRFSLRDHGYFVLQALFLFSLNYLAIYLAEEYLSSGLVAITFSAIIFLNVAFGALFIRAPIRPSVLIGGGFGLFGLVLVFLPQLGGSNLSEGLVIGIGLALAGTVLASLGNIVSARNQQNRLPVVQSNAFGMAYGAVIMLAVSFVRGAPLEFDTSTSYVVSLLYLAVFGSVIGFGSYLTLLGRIGSDRVAYVTVLFPIVALALSTAFEGLTWSPIQLAGVLIAVTGNLFALGKIGRLRLSRMAAGAD